MSDRLTPKQRGAIDLLRACDYYDNGWGAVASGETCRLDGQPWINWRTAYSLRAKGVVEIEEFGPGDGARVRLVDRTGEDASS